MDLLSDPDLLPLLERSTEGELEINGGIGRLRIDLKRDDIRLWQDTLVTISTPGNLLLACEKGEVHLEATRLTWVVGAAIRTTQVEGAMEAGGLLEKLGIDKDLVLAARQHCPGLGGRITWAFYLERHGWLTATPVAAVPHG